MNLHYLNKYLKYKNKYLNLKNIKFNFLKGGNVPIFNIDDIKFINQFNNDDMELYLNPIYGLFLHESGLLKNLYFLNKENYLKYLQPIHYDFIYNNINILINNIFLNELYTYTSLLRPTNHITNDSNTYTPYNIGRYIAYLYLVKEKKINLNSNFLNKKYYVKEIIKINNKDNNDIINNYIKINNKITNNKNNILDDDK